MNLALQHHVDQGFPVDEEVRCIFRHALILLVGEHFNPEAVVLLDSSSMRLPQSLEDSNVQEISAYLRGPKKTNDRELELSD